MVLAAMVQEEEEVEATAGKIGLELAEVKERN